MVAHIEFRCCRLQLVNVQQTDRAGNGKETLLEVDG
jgi:hypothetical protein